MPLESHVPNLDDRRYDDIVEEVRTRIARYTPEWTPVWTDMNDSDPGVTMVQVFAWLSEMLLYRLGHVPQLNYLKFLQLVGIELRPAEPARAEVTFRLSSGAATPETVIIRSRTQVAAEPPGGGPPVIFETTRALAALRSRLVAVQAFDGYSYRDVTGANAAPGQGFQPFGPTAASDDALYLGFDEALPQAELDLTAWLSPASGADGSDATAFRDCNGPSSVLAPPVRLLWEYWNGSSWVGSRLTLLDDETQAFSRDGHLRLRLPPAGTIHASTLGDVSDPLHWLRARIDGPGYNRAPALRALRTNTALVEQAETVLDEVLGGSDGRPNQTFRLENTPVLSGSLRLEIDEGELTPGARSGMPGSAQSSAQGGATTWTERDDLLGSGPDDRHYVLNRTSGEILLGDGVHGRIASGNIVNRTANVTARSYRVGGGKRGNVGAGSIASLLTDITGVDSESVTNLAAAYGGRDEQRLEDAMKQAPHAIKSNDRAVTPSDFENFATQAATIRRAKALPLHHPDFPGTRVPGVITVVVVPDQDDDRSDPPVPSAGTLRTVCTELNRRRLLTTELYVIPPSYHLVSVAVGVTVNDNADLRDVKERVEEALLRYFHPLVGGDDGQGWPFGGDIFYSNVFQRIFAVPGGGVLRLDDLEINVDGETYRECQDVTIEDPDALLFSREHDVRVSYPFGGAA